MSDRHLGAVALQRFLVVERYIESRQPPSSTHHLRSPDADRARSWDPRPQGRDGQARRA